MFVLYNFVKGVLFILHGNTNIYFHFLDTYYIIRL
jgi:hypothetical protein